MIRIFGFSMFALVLAACSAGPKNIPERTDQVVAAGLRAVSGPYRISVPDDSWFVRPNVVLRDGLAANFLFQHGVGETADAVVVVTFSPAANGGPAELARGSSAEDERNGAAVSEVSCTKEAPPSRCEYGVSALVQSGKIAGRSVVLSVQDTKETATFTGSWPADKDDLMRKAFDAIVGNLKVIKK